MKGKTLPISISGMIVLLLFFFSVHTAGAQTAEHQWGKIGFQVPLAFSSPKEIGMDAAAMQHPPESPPGKGQMEITLVGVSKGLQESLENKDEEIRKYVKGTFLGSVEPATRKTERTFLGKKVVGEGQTLSIPRKGELEFYLVPLSDGDKVAVAFFWDPAFPKEKVDSVIAKVAESLKEIKGK